MLAAGLLVAIPASTAIASGDPVLNDLALIAGNTASYAQCGSYSETQPTPPDGDGAPAGSGTTLCQPAGVASIGTGTAAGTVIADTENMRIRFIPSASCSSSASCPFGASAYAGGDIYTIAGNGELANGNATTIDAATAVPATSVPLDFPSGVAADGQGDVAFSDEDDGMIRLVSNQSCTSSCPFGLAGMVPGDIYTIGGGYATFQGVTSVVFDAAGDLLVADGYDEDVELIPVASCSSSCPYGLTSMTPGVGVSIAGADSHDETGYPVAGDLGTAADLTGLTSVATDPENDVIITAFTAGVDATVDVLSAISCPSAATPLCPYQLAAMTPGDIYPIAGSTVNGSQVSGAYTPTPVSAVPGPDALIPDVSDAIADAAGNVIISPDREGPLLVLGEESCTADATTDCPYGLASIVPGELYQVSRVFPTSTVSGTPASQLAVLVPAQLAVDASGDLLLADVGLEEVVEVAQFAASSPGSTSTASYPRAPSVPSTVVAGEGGPSGSIGVSWQASAADGSAITTYEVVPDDLTTASTLTAVAIDGTPPATSTTVSGLVTGDTYSFTVTATNADGTSAPSAPSVAVPLAATPSEQWNELDAAPSSVVGSGASAMAYDSETGEFILFTPLGETADGTYPPDATDAWNGTDWVELATPVSPGVVFSPAMAYDPALGGIVLFGGLTASGGVLNNTWLFNGNTWSELATSGGPSYTGSSSMAYDASTAQLVLFGGYAPSAGTSDSTYVWDDSDSSWTLAPDAIGPTGGNGSAMAYDPADSELVLVEGESSIGTDPGKSWTWNGGATATATWSEVVSATAPSGRSGATLVYDPTGSDLFFYGGNPGLHDSWSLNGSTWTELSAAPASGTYPSYSESGSAASSDTELLRFGGIQYSAGYPTTSATWSYGDPPPPPTVSNPVAVQGAPGFAGLSWQQPADPGETVLGADIDNFGVPISTSGFEDDPGAYVATTFSTTYSFTVAPEYLPTDLAELQGDQTSGATVGSFTAAAPFESDWSPPYPAAPSAVSATPAALAATVDWTVPPNYGWTITGFNLVPYRNGAALSTIALTPGAVGSSLDPTPGASDSDTLTGLAAGSYSFKIQAADDYEEDNISTGPFSASSNTINVAATSVPDPSITTSLDLGSELDGGTSPSQAVVVGNGASATADLDVSSVSLGGPDLSDFAIATDGCTGQDLAAGTSCSVEVTFDPPSSAPPGPSTASVLVTDNATSSPQSVALSGQGVASTATALGVSANPATVGQPVTYTATVSPVPDGGTVELSDGSGALPGCGSQAVNLNNGEATCVDTYSSPGQHVVTATYSGDSNFAGSASTALTEEIDAETTSTTTTTTTTTTAPSVPDPTITTSLDLGPEPDGGTSPSQAVVVANGVSATADLDVTSVSLAGPDPSDFAIATDGCTGQDLAAGTSCSVEVTFDPPSGTPPGPYSASVLVADNATSSPQLAVLAGQAVAATATATALGVSANPATVDQPVTYTASVSPVPDGGAVEFSDGSGALPGCGSQAVNLNDGEATCVDTYSSPGQDIVTATYGGDSNFAGSASTALTEMIDASPATTTTAATTTTTTTTTTTAPGVTTTTAPPTTPTPTMHLGAPAPPTGLVATPGDGQVVLSWSPPASSGAAVTGYAVYQGTAPGKEASLPGNPSPIPSGATTYTVTGLTDGTTYYFVVQSLSSSGSSPFSNEASATPTAPGPLAPGTVFVSDFSGRVLEIPPDGGAQTSIGSGLNLPAGLAIDVKGNLYIADENNSRVVKVALGSPGAPETVVNDAPDHISGGIGLLSDPVGVAVDGAGNVFVANTNGENVVEYPSGGRPEQLLDGRGTDHQLIYPGGVAVNSTGDAFIADTGADAIVRIRLKGGVLTVTAVASSLDNPTDVAVDAAGDLFITEMGATTTDATGATGATAATGPSGELLEIAPNGTQTVLATGLYAPDAVAVGPGGNLYLADENGLIELNPATGVQTSIGTGLDRPVGVAVYDPPGQVSGG